MEQDNQKSALLVMDMQAAIIRNISEPGKLLTNSMKAIAHARGKKIQLIYVIVGFRPGMPEISNNNKSSSTLRQRLAAVSLDEWMKIESSLEPSPADIIVTKRRVSAFSGSDLEVVLRAQGIQHIILSGVATGGVVLSTLREAADKDYRITVLSDCCADSDAEVHQVLIGKIFPRQAEVITCEEWTRM